MHQKVTETMKGIETSTNSRDKLTNFICKFDGRFDFGVFFCGVNRLCETVI